LSPLLNSLTSSNLPGTGFSLFFRLLLAYHPKDLEDLHDNCGVASGALSSAGGGSIKLLATGKGFRFNLSGNALNTKLKS
jgi:hypothetical protein